MLQGFRILVLFLKLSVSQGITECYSIGLEHVCRSLIASEKASCCNNVLAHTSA